MIKKITNFIHLLRLMWVLGWRSFIIVLNSYKKNVNHRHFINTTAKTGATKLLNIVNAKYNIEFTDPSLFEGDQSYIFMSNHQSLFDVPLIYATIPFTVRFVTKNELFKIPIFGRSLHVGECVPVHRGQPERKHEFFQIAKERLSKGVSLWIFPEGTRSFGNDLLKFKTGGFQLATQTLTKIVPVGIVNTSAILFPKKSSLSFGKMVSIRVGKPIDPTPFINLQDKFIGEVRSAIKGLINMPS